MLRVEKFAPFEPCIVLTAGLVLFLSLVSPPSPLAAKTRSYERDLETARKLYELEERLEDAELLNRLDSVDEAIVDGACREKWQAYSESTEEVEMLGARLQAGARLTPDEAQYYEDQKRAMESGWTDFKSCYTRELPRFSQYLPPGLSTYYDVVTRYDQLLEKHRGQGLVEGHIQASINQIEEEIERLESEPASIATVLSAFRRVEVVREGRTQPLGSGDPLFLGDVIRTGPRGRARIEWADHLIEKNAGPTVANIGGSSEVSMQAFAFKISRLVREDPDKLWYEHALDFVRGKIRLFSKNWGSGSAFSVRVGTSLCGIRGTDIEIDYTPELDEATFTLHSGVVEIETPSGRVTLKPAQTVTVKDGVPGAVRPAGPPS